MSGAPGAAAPAPTDAELYKDPLTDEPVLEDWEFNILIAVAIDPPPFAPQPAAGQQANAQ
jgi:hypothetical protein